MQTFTGRGQGNKGMRSVSDGVARNVINTGHIKLPIHNTDST